MRKRFNDPKAQAMFEKGAQSESESEGWFLLLLALAWWQGWKSRS